MKSLFNLMILTASVMTVGCGGAPAEDGHRLSDSEAPKKTISCNLEAPEQELAINAVRFAIPSDASSSDPVVIEFLQDGAVKEDLTIKEGMDFYSRNGKLALVSGGVFGENFVPVVKLRAFFNTKEDSQSGFAEITLAGAETATVVNLKGCQ